jgi:hypothetical protein
MDTCKKTFVCCVGLLYAKPEDLFSLFMKFDEVEIYQSCGHIPTVKVR